MDEDKADEIIAKLDELALNTITREQGDEILEKLKEISKELEQFHIEFLKMSD